MIPLSWFNSKLDDQSKNIYTGEAQSLLEIAITEGIKLLLKQTFGDGSNLKASSLICPRPLSSMDAYILPLLLPQKPKATKKSGKGLNIKEEEVAASTLIDI